MKNTQTPKNLKRKFKFIRWQPKPVVVDLPPPEALEDFIKRIRLKADELCVSPTAEPLALDPEDFANLFLSNYENSSVEEKYNQVFGKLPIKAEVEALIARGVRNLYQIAANLETNLEALALKTLPLTSK